MPLCSSLHARPSRFCRAQNPLSLFLRSPATQATSFLNSPDNCLVLLFCCSNNPTTVNSTVEELSLEPWVSKSYLTLSLFVADKSKFFTCTSRPKRQVFFRYSVLFIAPAPEVFFSRVRLDVSLSTAGRQIFGQSHERHGWTETGNRAWIVSGTQVTLFLCCVLKRTVLSSQYSFLSVYCATKQNFWRCQCCSCSTDLRTQQNVFNKKVHKPARCLQWSFRLIV